MQHATALVSTALAAATVSDDAFAAATALLATRIDPRASQGDIRDDPEAPQVLEQWCDHASVRVPDLSVWQMSCQIHQFFDPERGRVLPAHWPWDTRERILGRIAQLQSRAEWCEPLREALARPSSSFLDAIACCAASRLGRQAWPVLWQYLTEHVDDGHAWGAASATLTGPWLPDYLDLARRVLTTDDTASARGIGRSLLRVHVWREVLGTLARHPGHGIDLIEHALQLPDTELRLLAAELLLRNCRGGRLPPDTHNFVREHVRDEGDPAVKELMRLVLARV